MYSGILIVEDNKETCDLLEAALQEAGYKTHCVGGVGPALDFLATHHPTLIVLDMVLPDGHGLDVCCRVRHTERLSAIPVISLTGQDTIAHKKKGFSSGVDVYLTKPIVMEELVMWVKALLRRVSMDKGGGGLFEAGDLLIDPKAQLVRYKHKAVNDLTRREFELLFALVKNSPRIISRKEILSEIWRTVAVENLVDTHMFNLRRKLPPELAEKVQSVAGRGFRYFDPD